MRRRQNPLVSVVTATWQRPGLLLDRCIPSVQAQTYSRVEHVVVSDGPDEALSEMQLLLAPRVRYHALARHNPRMKFGHGARVIGIAIASGSLIAYLDDDDAYRPQHIERLVRALDRYPKAGFAYSCAALHTPDGEVRIGDGPLARGRIAAGSAMMHRRELLKTTADWRNQTTAPDWDLVRRWVKAGVQYVQVPEVTVDYYPGRTDVSYGVPVAFPPARGGG